jgi:putative addiction module killer protein
MYSIKRTVEFDRWFSSLRDRPVIRLGWRLDKAQRGLLGDVKPVGDEVFEMREFFGSGWRMYYTVRQDTLILMLDGGEKSTQSADIKVAIALSKTIKDDDLED